MESVLLSEQERDDVSQKIDGLVNDIFKRKHERQRERFFAILKKYEDQDERDDDDLFDLSTMTKIKRRCKKKLQRKKTLQRERERFKKSAEEHQLWKELEETVLSLHSKDQSLFKEETKCDDPLDVEEHSELDVGSIEISNLCVEKCAVRESSQYFFQSCKHSVCDETKILQRNTVFLPSEKLKNLTLKNEKLNNVCDYRAGNMVSDNGMKKSLLCIKNTSNEKNQINKIQQHSNASPKTSFDNVQSKVIFCSCHRINYAERTLEKGKWCTIPNIVTVNSKSKQSQIFCKNSVFKKEEELIEEEFRPEMNKRKRSASSIEGEKISEVTHTQKAKYIRCAKSQHMSFKNNTMWQPTARSNLLVRKSAFLTLGEINSNVL